MEANIIRAIDINCPYLSLKLFKYLVNIYDLVRVGYLLIGNEVDNYLFVLRVYIELIELVELTWWLV